MGRGGRWFMLIWMICAMGVLRVCGINPVSL